ncbi:MAG: TetR/AcrR family transcriptional regulator [Firmicutes bacterium]|nr:TetR/AcrR family transcriptional regulator [Bacillota bacterium]
MREKIIQAAARQILKYGLRKFTIDEIASDLGISKKTVYKYFPGKRQIISAVVDSKIEEEKNCLLEALEAEGDVLDKLHAVLFYRSQNSAPERLLEELQRYFPDEWRKSEAIGQFMWEHMENLLRQGIASGAIREDIPTEIIGMALSKTIPALLDYKFLSRHDLTANQAVEQFKSMILYGIVKR